MVALATEVGAKKFSSEEETFSDLSILIFENNFKARCTAAAALALLKSALFSLLHAPVPGCCHCAAVLTGACMGLLQGIQTQFDVYHEAVETAAPEVRAISYCIVCGKPHFIPSARSGPWTRRCARNYCHCAAC